MLGECDGRDEGKRGEVEGGGIICVGGGGGSNCMKGMPLVHVPNRRIYEPQQRTFPLLLLHLCRLTVTLMCFPFGLGKL